MSATSQGRRSPGAAYRATLTVPLDPEQATAAGVRRPTRSPTSSICSARGDGIGSCLGPGNIHISLHCSFMRARCARAHPSTARGSSSLRRAARAAGRATATVAARTPAVTASAAEVRSRGPDSGATKRSCRTTSRRISRHRKSGGHALGERPGGEEARSLLYVERSRVNCARAAAGAGRRSGRQVGRAAIASAPPRTRWPPARIPEVPPGGSGEARQARERQELRWRTIRSVATRAAIRSGSCTCSHGAPHRTAGAESRGSNAAGAIPVAAARRLPCGAQVIEAPVPDVARIRSRSALISDLWDARLVPMSWPRIQWARRPSSYVHVH